jgi:hypothetical protein
MNTKKKITHNNKVAADKQWKNSGKFGKGNEGVSLAENKARCKQRTTA